MQYEFNVDNKREIIKLNSSKRFPKYPEMFLDNICQVRVNRDEYLSSQQFIIRSKYNILPKKIYLYGKKTRNSQEDNIYLNYWIDIFLKTIEKGRLCKYDFEKSDSKLELCIGLPLEYREKAFKYETWTKKDIIVFLSCLFDIEIEEEPYKQQNLFEELMVA